MRLVGPRMVVADVLVDDPQIEARGLLLDLEHSAAPGAKLPYRVARLPLVSAVVVAGLGVVMTVTGVLTLVG